MSEQHPDLQPVETVSYITRIGPELIAGRERLGLSMDDVSNRLRFSLRQIQALESDDFAVMPEAVITRGFIRNYARLVGIDATPLLHVYSQYVPVQDHQAISIPSVNIVIAGAAHSTWKAYVWFGGLLVLLLCAWIIYVDYFPKHSSSADHAPVLASSSSEPSPEQALTPEPVLPATSVAPATTAQLAEMPAEASQAVVPAESIPPAAVEVAPAAAITNPVPVAATPATGNARLKFVLHEASWVSVADASGKQILNKTLAANSEEVIDGRPPFRIIVGNAGGTALEYNSSRIDLAAYTKVNVARLTLE
ncbi:DUF4115 domain-containing protein [Methylobacillus gramineus]|uniref:helix-turn-helix domain-containing protein n=1 Tax=Methylobacillus gramineus TaxID=755169 RepID=UPI001CFFF7B0|nr:helix-turn-helix domain-containing protein [Methylobacillus gramineus]MCB5184147.1 DUF4115 domain-containing protein [Methylobacillus gramineus]